MGIKIKEVNLKIFENLYEWAYAKVFLYSSESLRNRIKRKLPVSQKRYRREISEYVGRERRYIRELEEGDKKWESSYRELLDKYRKLLHDFDDKELESSEWESKYWDLVKQFKFNNPGFKVDIKRDDGNYGVYMKFTPQYFITATPVDIEAFIQELTIATRQAIYKARSGEL